MPLKDIAREDPIAAPLDATVGQIAELMDSENVGSVIVTDGDHRPKGIVTDRDLVRRALTKTDSPNELHAEDVMTPDPCTADADGGILEATEQMCGEEVRRLPVTENGKLSGIVTMTDLETLFTTELSNLSKVAESESPPWPDEDPTA